MIYRCSSKDCGYWCEGEMLEGAACPWCGKELLRAEEKNMSGDDWAALGGFWSEQGAKGKARMAECFRKAAYLGSAWGTCNLGICMEQGDGVERNPEQAFWLYSQAMEMGSLNAVCCLGVCYECGVGTEKNLEHAVALYHKAAKYGSPRAQMLLARAYYTGRGTA